jgi:hypothetical protein
MNETTLDKPWELEMLDWSAPGRDGRKISPDTVLDLVFSDTAESAAAAYEKLDWTVCANGIVFEAAVPVLKTLLGLQPAWTTYARPHALELLSVMCAGESVSGTSVREECLQELRGSLWYFLHGLQFDAAESVWMHVDLLCLLALEFSDLRPKVTEYLRRALTRDLPDPTPELIRNTIAEIEHPSL